jgi:acylphosphatase
MPELAHLSALVHGRVQGVYYRAFTSRVARSLQLKGYVRNIHSTGDVEVDVEGERARLEDLIEKLKQGPPDAAVTKIDIKWSDYTGQFSSFDVRY